MLRQVLTSEESDTSCPRMCMDHAMRVSGSILAFALGLLSSLGLDFFLSSLGYPGL